MDWGVELEDKKRASHTHRQNPGKGFRIEGDEQVSGEGHLERERERVESIASNEEKTSRGQENLLRPHDTLQAFSRKKHRLKVVGFGNRNHF